MNKPPHQANSPAMQRILAALSRQGDMSASDLSRVAFVGMTTLVCGGYLQSLREQHLIHVSGWRKASNGFVTPLFSLGDLPDFPRPLFEDVDRNSAGMRRIVEALERHGPLSITEISIFCGLSRNTIKNARYMQILTEQQRVHVSGWHRNKNGPMTAEYSAGEGESVPRPPVLTDAERRKRWSEKRKALSVDPRNLLQLLNL